MEVASMCWIAASLWSGWNDRRTRLVQFWLRNVYSKTIFGNLFCRLYSRYGERVAEQVRKRSVARSVAEPLFGWFLLKAQEV